MNKDGFHKIFDGTLIDIANYNIDIFSLHTGGRSKIRLFEAISQYIVEEEKKDLFCKAIISKLANFSFNELFSQKYDFFADIFEYLIKNYNKDFGKYAEYYTPHSIASIIAKIMVPKGDENVSVYDPSAGSGTLVLALAHEINENYCTIYTQDISQKSNEFLRLNLILNNLVHSLPNVIHEDTLINPRHLTEKGDKLMQFDYIVSNPPFNMDFSESRDILAGEKYKKRFFAGVPNIPKKNKKSMPVYLMFLQHIIVSLNDNGKAAVVVPSGFLTDTGGIASEIRKHLIENSWLSSVVQMPTNVFANTNTSVSILFIDKNKKNNLISFVDASKLGKSEKIEDLQRVIISPNDEEKIIKAVNNNIEVYEFSKVVEETIVKENDYLIKPGLYFEMAYPKLNKYYNDMEIEKTRLIQQLRGLYQVTSDKYSRNLFIKWFVEFDYPTLSNKFKESEYGPIPQEYDLIPLSELLDDTIGGQWGKEEKTGNYTEPIKCIRGTDIPDVITAKYDRIPTRFVQKKHIEERRIVEGDILLEISGGSPIQSTGRIAYIDDRTLSQLGLPVLCTNFCRILRFKDPFLSKYVYDYLQLLYDRKYFFNLENNTTGIKNLILKSFIKNIRVVIPKDTTLIKNYYNEIEDYTKSIYKELAFVEEKRDHFISADQRTHSL